ncbi:Ada metal-binding domain-containing protein [Nocardioides acrostichi]|uniref:DNA-3-methyladenine glycosylase II n=1 Tax=Nocardioides acrostichi TaxID=2784339 RepID=A0A930UVI1_9ACTN|nr:Ada metal-binding domain-containing protein [Nocardioides acrostichi]MBF4160407.1 DNA-3-methyladenine glycosylase 2 family protein [Nocardioides acrostichi]
MTSTPALDEAACYAAASSRDRRFDGVFYVAVRTTGIYCRPSCPARTPARHNVTFHRTAASAQGAGYRACKRCLPDATPGSPEWDVAADVAGRAMRLVADGVVDREGVDGLARRIGYTPRHLTRLLVRELGAGPLALARARRAQTARTLVETTELGFTDVAFAAGFSSVRQFNDTLREVYRASPTELRARRAAGRGPASSTTAGELCLRLAVRTPYAAGALVDFLGYHVVPGLEAAGPGWYARTLDLPHGPGTVRVEPPSSLEREQAGRTAFVIARFRLASLLDTSAAVERTRRLLDADADPGPVDALLGRDALLAPLVAARPGLRVPGQVDGDETAIRTVIGQQVSVAGARTVTARIVAAHGRAVRLAEPGLTHLFPRACVLAEVDPATLPMPRARGRALVGLAAALAGDDLWLDRGADRAEVRARLLALPGIGPWTADYVAMRALADPDVFLPTDVGVRTAARNLGRDLEAVLARTPAWSPWRSTALLHLWQTLIPPLAPAPDLSPDAQTKD